MKKLWRYRWYTFDPMVYDFQFSINDNSFKADEIIINFLQIGAQYQLFEPLTLSREDFIRSVIEPVNDFLNDNEILSKFTSNKRFYMESLEQSTLEIPKLYTTVPFPDGDRIKMIRLPLVSSEKEPSIQYIAYIYIGINFKEKFPFYVGFNSHSDIWWPDLHAIAPEGALRVYEYLDIPLDNRPFAYRITPRLNSFLRDMNAITRNLGGKIYYEKVNQYCTEEGVLLDGKIIYQEDIDEGRMVPPNECREMDPETIEKLKEYNLL